MCWTSSPLPASPRPWSTCIIWADQIIDHVASRKIPRVIISDERDQVLGTGGGVVKALPLLGDEPFFHLNSDTMWIDGVQSNLTRLAEAFDPARMDILLLMAPTASSIGYGGRGDYSMLPDGALRKRREHQVVPFVYAGAAIFSPAIFASAPRGEFSLTKMFDAANEQERLFGLRLDGVWMHVGTPDAVGAAEEAFLESVAYTADSSCAASCHRSSGASSTSQPLIYP